MKLCWVLLVSAVALAAQEPNPLTETGQIPVDGHATPYEIRHLPVSSFPQLPAKVLLVLNQQGCVIPQTYEAHQPENVVHGSFAGHGSSDWAVLCAKHGTASLLVFFSDGLAEPIVLASAPETERLEPHGANGTLGFDWGIDAASPEQVHEAQAGMRRRPPRLDHDAVAESVVDLGTVYHFYAGNAWTIVETQD